MEFWNSCFGQAFLKSWLRTWLWGHPFCWVHAWFYHITILPGCCCCCISGRAVIDIHLFSIRSLTFYFSIPIISIRFWRTALIEYFHIFHTIFVDRLLRFPPCKDNEGFLNTFWLNIWVSLQNSKAEKGWKNVFRLIDIKIDIIFFSINWKNYIDRSILVISMTVLISGSASIASRSRPSRR